MSLAAKAVKGVAWTIGSTVGSRIVGTIATLIVLRYVNRSIMGEVALAHAITLNAHYLSNLGVDRYPVSYPKSGRGVTFHATCMHLALGFTALAIVVVFREPLAYAFNGTSLLVSYLPGMALAVVFERTGQVPEKILTRDMRFRVIGLTRTFVNFLFAGVSVGLAYNGWGGMAIIVANVCRAATQALIYNLAVEAGEWLEPCRLRWETFRRMLDFGVPLALGSFAHLASRTWDNLFMGKLFGPRELGAYYQAYNLADIPGQIGENIGDVLLPGFAKLDDDEWRRESLVRSTTLLMLIMSPMAIGLGAVAQTAVYALLPPDWWVVAPLLSILSGLSVVRPLGWTVGNYLQARGLTRIILVLEIQLILSLMLFLLLFSQISVEWACVGVGLAFTLQSLTSVWAVQRIDHVPFGRNVWRLIQPVLACAPLVGAVLGVRYLIGDALPMALLLVLEIIAGGVAYIAAALVIAPKTSRDFLGLIQKLFAKIAPEPDEETFE